MKKKKKKKKNNKWMKTNIRKINLTLKILKRRKIVKKRRQNKTM
jgi:hypothetical protein